MPLKHLHAEAFMIMLYATEERDQHEWIWNSRDGAVLATIPTRSGGRQMHHQLFQFDHYCPNHVPGRGDRIFADMTEQRAERFAREWAHSLWGRGLEQHYSDIRTAMEERKRELLNGGSTEGRGAFPTPDLLTVDELWIRGRLTELMHAHLPEA